MKSKKLFVITSDGAKNIATAASGLLKNNLDGHKLHLHPERVAKWKQAERVAPICIDMGITQTFNIACKFCYHMAPKNRTQHILPTRKLIQFLKESAEIGVRAIGFLGDGEPMLHPGVYDAVEKGSEFGLDMAIATNGISLQSDRLVSFLESLRWIRFTLAVVEPSAYKRVMGGTRRLLKKRSTI